MDAFSEPGIQEVVGVLASQSGKTEIILNVMGYFIDLDPCPMLCIQPTVKPMAEAFSKDRIAPMIRDTESLSQKVSPTRSRNSENTLLHKTFAGGHLTIGGANSPASLASRPIRICLQDEIDRYPRSVGKEGDPTRLADRRANNFWNRKLGKFSSPTIMGASRIWERFEASDMRYYYVPCPNCGARHKFEFKDFDFSDRGTVDDPLWICPTCKEGSNESHKIQMVGLGEWVQEGEHPTRAGFHLNGFYTPWVSWSEHIREFLEVKDDIEALQTWVNTVLAECWEERGEDIDPTGLMERREDYEDVPEGVLLITSSADVQQNRLEAETVGWGVDGESWGIDRVTFYGDPSNVHDACWRDLDRYFAQQYQDANGNAFHIAAACVDSSYLTDVVYAWCADKGSRRIYAIKGKDGEGQPAVWRMARIRTTGKKPKTAFNVGVDGLKSRFYGDLQRQDEGPGYCHFPLNYPKEFFEQATAERRMTKFKRGFPYKEWVKHRDRNEALDIRVYNYAALATLNVNWRTFTKDVAIQTQGATVMPTGRRVRSKGIRL